MKWDKKEKFVCWDKIFEMNLRKIINAKIDEIYVIFPYNQQNLLVPDDQFWSSITENMSDNSFLICSPNALIKAFPSILHKKHLITANEMVLEYWKEIQSYIGAAKVRSIIIVSSDINIQRIKRDFSIVFGKHEHKFKVEYKILIVSPSFWKTVYKIRELIVLHLPMWLYRFLGHFSS